MQNAKQRTVPPIRGIPTFLQLAGTSAQVALLWLMSWAGHEVVTLVHLPLPGNVAGMATKSLRSSTCRCRATWRECCSPLRP
jgi:hypothetical protein